MSCAPFKGEPAIILHSCNKNTIYMYANIFCTTQILLLNYSIKNLLRTHLHSHTTHFFTHLIYFQQLIKLPYFYKNILDYFFNRLMIYMDLDSSSAAAAVDYNQEKHVFHVLAVDDSHIDRKLLERLLTVSSYQVTCVDSGDKALEYLGLMDNIKNNEYEISPTSSSTSTISYESSSKSTSSQQEVSKVNLIMTDYSMPGITGYDLLKRIKDSSWKDVPVVVMSSENVPSRINMCLEEGAEEFLLKPVKLSDVKKIHSHLLKCTITAHPCDQTTSVDDNLAICNDETTTSNDTNRDDNENDKNCSNASKRKATLTTSSDRRPRVQELPVS